jgi:transcription elongation factor Elf1
MAKMMREVVVCDVCGGEESVATVTIALDGEQQTADVCGLHCGQLQDAVAGVLGGGAAATGRPRARRGRKVEAGRALAAKRPPRRAGRTGSTKSRMPRTTCPHCGMEMGVQNLSRHIAAKHPEAA